MKNTKANFEFTAALIVAAKNGVAAENLAIMAAAKFSAENPRFNEKLFFEACGVKNNN